jgi:hypothetical protein
MLIMYILVPSRFPAGARYVLHRVQTGSEATQPPIQWVPGSLSSELKQPGLEADHLQLVPRSKMVKLYLQHRNFIFKQFII